MSGPDFGDSSARAGQGSKHYFGSADSSHRFHRFRTLPGAGGICRGVVAYAFRAYKNVRKPQTLAYSQYLQPVLSITCALTHFQ